jgi:uncharacterized protein with PIN domain
MVDIAVRENRIILTRDTHILKRRLIISGKVRAILIKTGNIEEQIQQVIDDLDLRKRSRPFTLCLEDNQPLIPRSKDEVQGRVPPYVWKTQSEYAECPLCHRIYWKGTHWEAMCQRITRIITG